MKYIALLLFCVGCSPKVYHQHEGFTQGTTFNIIYEANDNFNSQIDSLLVAFSNSLSNYNPNSILSKVNNNVDTLLDSYFIECFELSKLAHEQSEGLFDPTLNPLVEAYGFGAKNRGVPQNLSKKEIDNIMQYVGFDKVTLVNNKVVKQNPRITLDFSAIAQGLSVDVIAKFLEQNGVENYLVEIGGEIYTQGVTRQSKPWSVGVDTPEEGNNITGINLQTVLELQGRGLATSGNYRKFINTKTEKFTHTIDPRTGRSAKNSLLSVTIIASSAALSDAYATAAMVGGVEWTKEFVKGLANIDAYLIFVQNDSIKSQNISSIHPKITKK